MSGLEQRKANKRTIKRIASIVKAQSQASEREQDTDMNSELIDAANQPPKKPNLLLSEPDRGSPTI